MDPRSLQMIKYDKVRLAMFDLDGTLYEDMGHFDYYADRLKEKFSLDLQDDFGKDYRNAMAGKHVLQIGRMYDKYMEWIFTQKNGVIQEVFDWRGHIVPCEEWEPIYANGWQIDLIRFFSIGDAWWIPNAIARHYSLDPERIHEAFIATREYMMTPDFHMTKIHGLAECIARLKNDFGWTTVLVTNSPEVDSRAILQKLGLAECFTDCVFRARKPVRTKEVVQSLCAQFQVDASQVLSIGDNYINDCVPILELGGQAIHINLYHIPEELLEPTPRVDSMKEIVDCMANLQ